MAIVLTSIQDTSATFKNDANSNQIHGTINWGEISYNSETGKYEIADVQGTSVSNAPFDAGTVEGIPEADTIDPTKVFWFLVEVLEETLCPDCM